MGSEHGYLVQAGEGVARRISRLILSIVLVLIAVVALYALSRRNYLLYHSLAELFSIVIAAGVFMVGWNARNYAPQSMPFVYLAVVYLTVAVLDTFHTLTYAGMGVFPSGHYFANQIWIGTRFIEAVSLFVFILMPQRLQRLRLPWVVLGYGVAAAALLLSVITWQVFPEAFVEGHGQTTFKLVGEYAIAIALSTALIVLYRRRDAFDRTIALLIAGTLVTTILSELFFTLYQDNYGILNFVGHMLKITSFVFIYKAIIESGLRRPFETIFRDLRNNQERLEHANVTKDRFFSIIAHDLKNPIHGIAELSRLALRREQAGDAVDNRGSGIAARGAGTPLPTEVKELELIHESASMAVDLLEKLLIWARSQTGRLRVEPTTFDLSTVAAECKRLTIAQADDKGVSLSNEVSPGTIVFADPNMVTTVLRNLLSNGVKFCEPGGVVRVVAESQETRVSVSVRDTGVGMKPQELDDLFRLDASRTRSGTAGETGTGLGLIVCKEFVELNGGTIWAGSTRGKGSTFTFTLPTTIGERPLARR